MPNPISTQVLVDNFDNRVTLSTVRVTMPMEQEYYETCVFWEKGNEVIAKEYSVVFARASHMQFAEKIRNGQVYFPAPGNAPEDQHLIINEAGDPRKPKREDCTKCDGEGRYCPTHGNTYEEYPMDGCLSCGHECIPCDECVE